ELTGSDAEFDRWQRWYGELASLAKIVAPTMLEPLPARDELRAKVVAATGDRLWQQVFEQPIGQAITETFDDDLVRGVVATDALIGTHTSLNAPELLANRCFLYHLIGNGTGEWRVPVGGMGAVTGALERAAREAGADLVTGAEVTTVAADGRDAEVAFRHGDAERTVAGTYVLAGVAPAVLDRLRGRDPGPGPEGAQVKINMVLDRLPRLRSGHDPAAAFAGTFHIDEGYAGLEAAHATAAAGGLPDPLPGEVYCHTLTDPSILAPDLAGRGVHTLTLFGLHAPARLFAGDEDGERTTRDEAVRRHLAGLDAYLAEPIAGCLTRDADGRPCVEGVSPPELEASLGLPGGHIFHADLSWPWAGEGEERPDAQPGSWGVETDVANLFVCGAGARRGGGVSGIGGHNAAMAVLERAERR
ncbi:MAG TPA: hypothetical protein VH479_11775, partial [Acidimicrobiales bacterium]